MTDQVLSKIRSLELRLEALEKRLGGETTPIAVGKRESAKEFLLRCNAGPDTQKVLALAYFLEHVERMQSFSVSDLEAVFQAAKEKPPKNMNDAVNKNVSRGFVMDAKDKKDSKKAWQLTSTGERFVAQKLGR